MPLALYLPLLLPLTAFPVARLAGDHLHPRTATRLLTVVSVVLSVCSTLCLALLVVVGTAQLPGNPLPDGWSDAEVRDAIPHVSLFGILAIPTFVAILTAVAVTHRRDRVEHRLALNAVAGAPAGGELTVLPDPTPYAYALRGPPDRIVVSTGMLLPLDDEERRALIAHERAHLRGRHHLALAATRLAACAHPLLRPIHTTVAYTVERWADEDAAEALGDRRTIARAVGKAALAAKGRPPFAAPAFAAPGPVPRRVAALLGPPPPTAWPTPRSRAGVAALVAATGTTVSVLASLNAAVALVLLLIAATPL
ncbi:M56 family metallopeptidase [Embleya sp. NPDC056575]|uniref:M56 family metallopeptidase n=1 Tax=unclassified Embleya TaxID=2699296 RepID=UPI0036A3253A